MSENKANASATESKADSSMTSMLHPEESLTVSRIVTIFRKEESSAYYRRNAKFMPEGKIKIGSAINSVNRMRSNIEEIDFYMPYLLGVNKNDPRYAEKVDLWFNNISTMVPEVGLPLEVGFKYTSLASKKTVEDIEEGIIKKFNAAKKSNPIERDAAIDLRDKEIIMLESNKYKHGFPLNVNDYVLWRYCLVYSDVANDIALVNKSGGIRFYIYDAKREKQKEKVNFEVRNKATTLYVKLLDTPDKVANMLWVEHSGNFDVFKLDEMDRFNMLETMVRANPADFIKLYSDVHLDSKATIERLIHYGILKRLPNSSVIVDENTDVIGNNMEEAIIFFKNEERNKAAITTFKARLRSYTND
jgi:hypothetical protein